MGSNPAFAIQVFFVNFPFFYKFHIRMFCKTIIENSYLNCDFKKIKGNNIVSDYIYFHPGSNSGPVVCMASVFTDAPPIYFEKFEC